MFSKQNIILSVADVLLIVVMHFCRGLHSADNKEDMLILPPTKWAISSLELECGLLQIFIVPLFTRGRGIYRTIPNCLFYLSLR